MVAGNSHIDRKGVFTDRKFKKGSTVYVLQGKEISIPAIEQVYLNGLTRISADGFQLSEDRYLFLDTFSGYINHSCNPTCGVIEKSTLKALRDIAEGEEITYDYSTVEWTPQSYQEYDSNEWPMQCRCGEKSCRQLIVCFPYLPDSVQQKYLSGGMVPDQIKLKLMLPKERTRCLVCENAIRMRQGM